MTMEMLDADAELCQCDVITGSVPMDMEPMPCASHSTQVRFFAIGASGILRDEAPRPPLKHPDPIDIPSEPGVRWYCVRTDYGHELTADIEMRRLGLTVLLLQELRAATKDKRGVVKAGSFDRIVPLFPRYIFVAFDITDPTWRYIQSRRGVERIFGISPERPTPIPQKMIDVLLEQCAPNGVIYPAKVPEFSAVKVGATVEMLTGPFAQFRGICLLSKPDRIRLLVDVFGRATEMDVRSADVRVI
jgi:transcription antitermination factor NusG